MTKTMEMQLFKCLHPTIQKDSGETIPEHEYKCYINMEEILDYAEATNSEFFEVENVPLVQILYMNGLNRFVLIEFEVFHREYMKYKASLTKYIIKTKFN